MRVVVKEPGKQPEVREIGSDLDSMQAVIAHGDFDMIEHVQDGPSRGKLDDGPRVLDLWANEEGKYATKTVEMDGEKTQVYAEPNLSIFDGQDYVMGTVFIAASDEDGETLGLTDDEVAAAITWLKQHAVSITEMAIARSFAEQFR